MSRSVYYVTCPICGAKMSELPREEPEGRVPHLRKRNQ